MVTPSEAAIYTLISDKNREIERLNGELKAVEFLLHRRQQEHLNSMIWHAKVEELQDKIEELEQKLREQQ